MANSEKQNQDANKGAPKSERKDELSEKDLDKATGGSVSSGGDRPQET